MSDNTDNLLRDLSDKLSADERFLSYKEIHQLCRLQQAEIERLLKQRNIAADNCVEARQVARMFLTAAETLDRAAEIQRYPWLEDSTDATRTQDNRA